MTRPSAHTLRIEFAVEQGVGIFTIVAGASIVLGWFVANGHGKSGMVLAALLVTAPFVLRRAENGLLAGMVLILVVPSWVALGPPQAGVVRAAVALSLTGFVVLAVSNDAAAPRLTAPDLFLAGFVAAAWLSWVARPYGSNSGQATLAAVLPAVFYLAGRWFGGLAWTRLATVILLAGAVGSLTVLYEFAVTHRPLFTSPSSYYWNATGATIFRPGGVFGSPPAASATLAMTTLIGASVLQSVRGFARLGVWTCLGVSVAGLVLTFTRAGLIAVAVGVVVYLAVLRPPSLSRVAFGGILVLTLVCLFLLPSVTRTAWYQKGIVRPGNFAARESYWRAAGPVIVNSPRHLLVGHGINSLVRDPDLQDQLIDPQSDIGAVPTLSTLSPHSQYVRTLVEQGVVGLLLVLGWLGLSLLTAVRAAVKTPLHLRAPLAACAAAIVSFMIVCTVGDALRVSQCFALVALLSGAAVTLGQLRGRSASDAPHA